MRKSFVNVTQPMLAGVVKAPSVRDAIYQIKNCQYHGATGIDLHLSCMNKEELTVDAIRDIVCSSALPILALNYSFTYDNTYYEPDDDARAELFFKAVEAGVAAVDIQGYTFDPYSKNQFRQEFSSLGYSFIKDNPKEVVVDNKIIEKQMEFIEKIHAMGAEVLLSNHPGVAMNGEQLVDLALFLEKRNPDIIKIVTIANTEEEMVEALRAMVMLKKEIKTPVSYHCSGSYGKITRVVNPMLLGGFMMFCNDGFTKLSLIEQPDLATSREALDAIKKLIM